MSKFTEGPWETGSRKTKVQIWPVGWNVPMCIADCDVKYGPKLEEEKCANARLIAAAPTMYNLLKLAVEYLNHEETRSIPFAMNSGVVAKRIEKVLTEIEGKE